MSTPEENAADIAELLDLGITQVSTDGTTTSHNLKVIESRQRAKNNQDPMALLNGTTRPTIINFKARFRG